MWCRTPSASTSSGRALSSLSLSGFAGVPSRSSALASLGSTISLSTAYDRCVSSLDPAALFSPKLLAALVGFIDMTNRTLPALALTIERFGVPKDSNAAVVSLALYNGIPSAGSAKASPALPPNFADAQ